MKKTIILFAFILGVCLMSTVSHADWLKDTLKKAKAQTKTSSEPSDDKVIAGLKEALAVGTDKTVKRTGIIDGYFGNQAIKILMPDNMKKFESTLRKAGMGDKVDEFILSMNRAAEAAAPEAKDIFIKAIKQMTFDDARKIYKGSDTAATEYFNTKTRPDLYGAFKPIVKSTTDKNGVAKKYKALNKKYGALLALGGVESFDPDEYVTQKALDGLFYVLGEEERKIRKDPAARVTQILKEVFGR